MSAIYGAIYNAGTASREKAAAMEQAYSDCRIDRFECIVEKQAFMGCGLQYVTEEAKREQLPYSDQEILYTADVILDNRMELIKELNLDKEVPDGEILLQAFRKWKGRLGDHVIGLFSACFYCRKEREIWLFTDHTGSRCVNYSIQGEGFYFSTTITPILNAAEHTIGIDEKWITMCMSNCSADLLFVPDRTAFEGVFQLEAGHYLKVGQNGVQKVCYWNPLKGRKERKVTDEEGIRLFLETFSKCVKDAVRTSGEVGITLSSGLDSSSVACTAVGELRKSGKKLCSYTSVPIDGYQNDGEAHLLPDESKGVLKLQEAYPDILTHFVNCPERNAFTDLKSLIPVLECPYKSAVNLVWIDEIYRLASGDNCRVILKGQYGNTTISYGTLFTTMYQLLRKGNVARTLKEIKCFGAKNHIGGRRIVRIFRQYYIENRIKKTDPFTESFARAELMKKYKVRKIVDRIFRTEGNTWVDSRKQHQQMIYSLRIWAHLGAFDTKLGLRNGIVVRDPTKDKRMIELCLELPITCFAGNGYERRLVREGMQGIVPDAILRNVEHRGWQGADFAWRLERDWETIREDAVEMLGNPMLTRYMDASRLEELKREISAGISKERPRELIKLLVADALSEFLSVYLKE